MGENTKYRSYWNGMGEYVDELPSIAFHIWMSIIGLLVVFVTFTNKTLYGMIRRHFVKGKRHDKRHNHIQKPNNPYTLP